MYIQYIYIIIVGKMMKEIAFSGLLMTLLWNSFLKTKLGKNSKKRLQNVTKLF